VGVPILAALRDGWYLLAVFSGPFPRGGDVCRGRERGEDESLMPACRLTTTTFSGAAYFLEGVIDPRFPVFIR
jgi:hypothetical protein